MIAKRIDTKSANPRVARLVKYVVAAQGNLDPRSWTRTADYMLNSGTSSRGEKVGGVRVTNCHTDDPAAATALIECTQAANTRSKADKTYHLVFSFPPGEEPDLKILHKIEDELVAAIGYTDHQRISAVHVDTDHLHVHVAINKVRKIGKNYNNIEPYYDINSLMEKCDEIEIKYKLQRTNHGLEGEYDYDRTHDIKLGRRKQHDHKRRKQLSESYDRAIAGRPETETYDGLRNLSGSGMAHDKKRYSELLPGNARSSLDKSGTQHPDGLRRSGNGNSRNGSKIVLPQKLADAEAHSGVDTLTGYVMREVAPSMLATKSWQELHETLSAHGLQIKKRGAGLVIGKGQLWVKASDCDRRLSIKALSDKLGEFQPAQRKTFEKSTPFEPKPRQKHSASFALYKRYLQDREERAAKKQRAWNKLKHDRLETNVRITQWVIAQRALIKATMKGPGRRAALKLIRVQYASMRQSAYDAAGARRLQLKMAAPTESWQQWLVSQAKSGNEDALAVLRSCKNNFINGNILSGGNGRNSVLNDPQPHIDGHGRAIYNTRDGGLVIDRKEQIQSLKTTEGSMLTALDLASKRFAGQRLTVKGQDEFKREVAQLAGLYQINVRFTDVEMERTRVALAMEKTKSMNKGIEL